MSARIRSMKSNNPKSNSIKIFTKTFTSNFMRSSDKSPNKNNEFGITRSTKFSDNNITNTLASSIRSISQFKSRKKEKPIFINLEDFHKQFILNKNKDNNTLLRMNTHNSRYNSIKSKFISINDYPKNNTIRLKKSLSPSFLVSSSIEKSRNLLINDKHRNEKSKENYSNSYFSSIFDNKNKNKTLHLEEISKISKKKKINNNTESISNDFQSNIFKNIFSPNNINELEPINKQKESNIKLNILNTIIDKSIDKSSNSNNIDSNTNQSIHSIKGKIAEKRTNYYLGRNKISLNDQLAYPCFNSYLFARAKRYENVDQFMYKTRLMVLDKYIQNVNKNTYLKQMTLNENTFEKQMLNQRTLELMKKLFFSYNTTLDQYLKYLGKKFREMNEENERLKQNIIKICMDIDQMRQQMIRGLTLIREGYAIKFFLMCVKNHTLSIEKFKEEDIEDIENERLKLNENFYLISNKSKTKNRKNSRKSSLYFNKNLRKFGFFSSHKNVKLNDSNSFNKEDNNNTNKINLETYKSTHNVLKKAKKKFSPFVFDSIEEFFEHFDAISTKLNLLIKQNNDKYANIKYLKLELLSITKSTEGQRKECMILGNKIELYEQNLENLKLKNKKLSAQLDGYIDNKFQTDVKLTLVLRNIYNIYNNIKKYFEVKSIKKDDVITFGRQLYLKIIEDFYLKLTNNVLEVKRKYPIEYEKIKLQMEKRKKEAAFTLFQKLLSQKIIIKIDAVLKRSSKVIYQRFRKTNDYMKYYKSQKNKKKEKKKTKMELFFEYLDDKE